MAQTVAVRRNRDGAFQVPCQVQHDWPEHRMIPSRSVFWEDLPSVRINAE